MHSNFKTYYNHEKRGYSVRINNYGFRQCSPGFSPGYVSRKFYGIHYIYEGECILEVDNHIYTVTPGHMFIIAPGHVYNYTSSIEHPCTYRWVDISGYNLEEFINQSKFSLNLPVIPDSEDNRIGNLLREMTDIGKMSGKMINGYSWFLADALCENDKTRGNICEKYIEPAIEYIISNSEKKTTVSDVADYLKIDRSYLSRVFNEHMGIPIKKFIYNYHMNIAKSFLMYSELSIKDIALSTGYDDPLDFTKAFHRTYGMSPTKWREENSKIIQRNDD